MPMDGAMRTKKNTAAGADKGGLTKLHDYSGMTAAELANAPTVYRDDLLDGQTVIISGGGVSAGNGTADVVRLAEMLGAALVAGYARQDTVPNTHPLYQGPLGRAGAPEASEAVSKADVIVKQFSRRMPGGVCGTVMAWRSTTLNRTVLLDETGTDEDDTISEFCRSTQFTIAPK